MKLAANSRNGLMDIKKITPDGSRLVFTGAILGTLPVRVVLTPEEARKGLSLFKLSTALAALRIFMFG